MAQRPDTPDDSKPMDDTRPFPGPVPERGNDPREGDAEELAKRNPSEAPEPREEDRKP